MLDMHWTVHLEGGPQRVNHAAVAVGSYIYSFGGYSSSEGYEVTGKIDIYVLDTGNNFIILISELKCVIFTYCFT